MLGQTQLNLYTGSYMDLLLALTPLVVLISLILIFRQSVIVSACAALLLVIGIVLFRGVDIMTVFAGMTRGIFVASEIILIILGAVVMLYVARAMGLLVHTKRLLMDLSADYRVHVLLVSFGVVYFIEGAAGFGTPAIIAVPLFMALGFKPLWSVALALIADSIPVAFGAIGLPVIFGISSIIEPLANNAEQITSQVTVLVAGMNIFLTSILALALVAVSVRQRSGSLRHFTEFIPFALLSSLAVSVPAFLAAYLIGPELPSVIGGLAGVLIIGLMAHRRIGLPKDSHDAAETHTQELAENRDIKRQDAAIMKALAPYGLLVLLLITTRLPYLPIGDWLKSIVVGGDSLFGTAIPYSIEPLYSAATILLVCAVFAIMIFRKHFSIRSIVSGAIGAVWRPFIALIFVLSFVQVFIYSQTPTAASLPLIIAQALSEASGIFWPFVAPFVGALGSFVSGSATVSNLIFSGLQYDIALSSQLSVALMLSLQAIGAGFGNVIALHNVVAALTIAGVSERYSHQIIRKNIPPMVVMLVMLGIIGLVASVVRI